MGDLVEVRVEGGVHRVRMNRPEVMNALNRAMRVELLEALTVYAEAKLSLSNCCRSDGRQIRFAPPVGCKRFA